MTDPVIPPEAMTVVLRSAPPLDKRSDGRYVIPMSTHTLSFEVPSYTDYRQGGFGDLVAQCSCGSYDYVFSTTEGEYWHSLHTANPRAHGCYLTLHNPMPEGWAPESATALTVIPSAPSGPRTWTCPTCKGRGSVEAYGAHGGRFHQFGNQTECGTCGGSGRVHAYPQAA